MAFDVTTTAHGRITEPGHAPTEEGSRIAVRRTPGSRESPRKKGTPRAGGARSTHRALRSRPWRAETRSPQEGISRAAAIVTGASSDRIGAGGPGPATEDSGSRPRRAGLLLRGWSTLGDWATSAAARPGTPALPGGRAAHSMTSATARV